MQQGIYLFQIIKKQKYNLYINDGIYMSVFQQIISDNSSILIQGLFSNYMCDIEKQSQQCDQGFVSISKSIPKRIHVLSFPGFDLEKIRYINKCE